MDTHRCKVNLNTYEMRNNSTCPRLVRLPAGNQTVDF
jgi:hypothetical protein